MKLLIGGLAALLALAGSATAHYNGSENWHDFGTDLGAFGASPVGQPVGVCWKTDSTFLDASDPGGATVEEINGHEAGLGVDYDGDCDQQGDDPSVFGTLGGASNALPGDGGDAPIGVTLGFGFSLPPLPL